MTDDIDAISKRTLLCGALSCRVSWLVEGRRETRMIMRGRIDLLNIHDRVIIPYGALGGSSNYSGRMRI